MKYRMIQRCRNAFPIGMMCPIFAGLAQRVLWLDDRPPSARAQENVRERIRVLYADHDGVVGSPAAESFFKILKRERVNRQHYRTRAEARADIFDYIERCDNPRHRRRLDMQQQADGLLTQPSVITGQNPL